MLENDTIGSHTLLIMPSARLSYTIKIIHVGLIGLLTMASNEKLLIVILDEIMLSVSHVHQALVSD